MDKTKDISYEDISCNLYLEVIPDLVERSVDSTNRSLAATSPRQITPMSLPFLPPAPVKNITKADLFNDDPSDSVYEQIKVEEILLDTIQPYAHLLRETVDPVTLADNVPTYDVIGTSKQTEHTGQLAIQNTGKDADEAKRTGEKIPNWRHYFIIMAVVCSCLVLVCSISIGYLTIKLLPNSGWYDFNLDPSSLDDCREQVEAAMIQWMNESQQVIRGYTVDADKALQCLHFTPTPHQVLHQILDSYESLNKSCQITLEKIDEEVHVESTVHVELSAAILFKQSLQTCLKKPFCSKSPQENGSCAGSTRDDSKTVRNNDQTSWHIGGVGGELERMGGLVPMMGKK